MSTTGIIILAVVLLVLFGGFGRVGGNYGYGYGNGGIGVVGLLFLFLLFMVLTGRL